MSVKERTIQGIYEKMGFRALAGSSDLEEEWESPTVLLMTGTTEMENDDGALLVAPVTIRIEFGEGYLDISHQKAVGKTA